MNLKTIIQDAVPEEVIAWVIDKLESEDDPSAIFLCCF